MLRITPCRDASKIERDEVFGLLNGYASFGRGASFGCPVAEHDDEVIRHRRPTLRPTLLDLRLGVFAGLVTVEQNCAGGLELVPAAREIEHVGDVRPAWDKGDLVQVEALGRRSPGSPEAGVHACEQYLVGDALYEKVVTADKCSLCHERPERGTQGLIVVL